MVTPLRWPRSVPPGALELAQEEAQPSGPLSFPPPLSSLPQVGRPGGALPDGASLVRIEALLSRIARSLEEPAGRNENLAFGEVITPSTPIGTSLDLKLQLYGLGGKVLSFSLFTILQVEIAAPALAATDAARLRFYYSGSRREPLDVLAEFDGASQVAGMWYAAFSNRGIQYRDSNKENTVWMRVRNTAGNSVPTIFLVRVYGFAFP